MQVPSEHYLIRIRCHEHICCEWCMSRSCRSLFVSFPSFFLFFFILFLFLSFLLYWPSFFPIIFFCSFFSFFILFYFSCVHLLPFVVYVSIDQGVLEFFCLFVCLFVCLFGHPAGIVDYHPIITPKINKIHNHSNRIFFFYHPINKLLHNYFYNFATCT